MSTETLAQQGGLASFLTKKDQIDSELDSIFNKTSDQFTAPAPVFLNKPTPQKDDENNNKIKFKLNKAEKAKKREINKAAVDPLRTVFVGNVSVEAMKKPKLAELRQHFMKFGTIQSIRFRSIALEQPMSRKVGYIAKKLHPKRSIANAYILFETPEGASKSLEANGDILFERHLRVDLAVNETKEYPKKLSIFLGNLPFDIEEEAIWNHFSSCGKIIAVRVVRDSFSNLGKGFGYVYFQDESSVHLAKKLSATELEGRKIRISRCLDTALLNKKGNDSASNKKIAVEGERSSKFPKKTSRIKKPRHRDLKNIEESNSGLPKSEKRKLNVSSVPQAKVKKPRHRNRVGEAEGNKPEPKDKSAKPKNALVKDQTPFNRS